MTTKHSKSGLWRLATCNSGSLSAPSHNLWLDETGVHWWGAVPVPGRTGRWVDIIEEGEEPSQKPGRRTWWGPPDVLGGSEPAPFWPSPRMRPVSVLIHLATLVGLVVLTYIVLLATAGTDTWYQPREQGETQTGPPLPPSRRCWWLRLSSCWCTSSQLS